MLKKIVLLHCEIFVFEFTNHFGMFLYRSIEDFT